MTQWLTAPLLIKCASGDYYVCQYVDNVSHCHLVTKTNLEGKQINGNKRHQDIDQEDQAAFIGVLAWTDPIIRPHWQTAIFSRKNVIADISNDIKSPLILQQKDQGKIWQACSHPRCREEIGSAPSAHVQARPVVTVDGHLVFGEKSCFRQCITSKSGKYSIKIWQPIMQKPAIPGIKRLTQAKLWVASLKKTKEMVLKMTTGLQGNDITCDFLNQLWLCRKT